MVVLLLHRCIIVTPVTSRSNLSISELQSLRKKISAVNNMKMCEITNVNLEEEMTGWWQRV